MTEVMQGLVSEAKKNKYTSIDPTLTDEDVTSVWDNVAAFIEKQMSLQKGVVIPGFGTFTFTQKKLDVGNNKYILMQRPVFMLSEKFAQTHGVNATKHHTVGQIPVVPLNYSALSFESPFDRDTVESCVKEVLSAVARSLSTKRNVEFQFQGIGRLHIRDNKVKMKFYKDFLNSMDGSGRLVDALKDRPGTVDSVMSNRSPTRSHTSNTVVLPSPCSSPVQQNSSPYPSMASPRPPPVTTTTELDVTVECFSCIRIPPGNGSGDEGMPPILEEEETGMPPADGGADVEHIQFGEEQEKPEKKPHSAGARVPSRQAAPIAQAGGVSFGDDFMPVTSPRTHRGAETPMKSSPTPMLMKRSLSPLPQSPNLPPPPPDRPEFERAKSMDAGTLPSRRLETLRFAPTPPATPPGSACGHANAGQELCYLCHQRDRRNVPVSFTEERKRRELEEDRLLQQYQHMKDTDHLLTEQEGMLAKRHESQKMAAFNLGVSEAVNTKKVSRDLEFHPSYVFQKRPLTPPRYIKQEEYSTDLAGQVNAKEDMFKKKAADEAFLERLEQVQLAEDLAAQRHQFIQDKNEQQEQYKRALSAQIVVRDSMMSPPVPDQQRMMREVPRLGPLTLPRPKVRFKPVPMPARVSDSSSPVFGRNDLNTEKLVERRAQAHQLYKDQLATVEQRKRDAILKRLGEQKDEDDMLKRAKNDLLDDRAARYERLFRSRRQLESDWVTAKDGKRARELEERLANADPGMLVHEQCDKYRRCAQCKRRTHNCGESNIWRESRYIPGSRLMV